jgi:hypothetical protein
MAIKRKTSKKNLYVAIVLIVILAVSVAAVVYATLPSAKKVTVGVHVGESFTYSITGSCSDPVPDSLYPGFYQLNDTQYYEVTITSIEGSSVSLKTDWVFINGTDIPQQQTIDLSNGVMADPYGFSFLYPANLKVKDMIYPINNTVPINATVTQTYASGARESAYYHVGTTQFFAQDPTQSTQRILYDEVYIDQQTGIMTNFSEIQEYNSPSLELQVIYSLTNSTVWDV